MSLYGLSESKFVAFVRGGGDVASTRKFVPNVILKDRRMKLSRFTITIAQIVKTAINSIREQYANTICTDLGIHYSAKYFFKIHYCGNYCTSGAHIACCGAFVSIRNSRYICIYRCTSTIQRILRE